MAYPYYPVYPYQYQPQQQTTPPAQPIAQSGIVWISGEQEATMYPIAPNNAVALWDKSGKTIYLKSADATGRPSIKVYDLVERAATPTETAPAQYATKDDLAAVVGVVKGFDELIGGLKTDIEAMKSDMYGIAGKKRKKETEDAE